MEILNRFLKHDPSDRPTEAEIAANIMPGPLRQAFLEYLKTGDEFFLLYARLQLWPTTV
jgi:hypothetical protein